jgi:ribosomal protein L14E/L6E/L27E
MGVPMEVGQVVISTAGHDRGRTYVVIGHPEEGYVLLTDGRRRPVGNPKKKKIRHLRAGKGSIDWIRERVLGRVSIYDHEIRKHLEPYVPVTHKEG